MRIEPDFRVIDLYTGKVIESTETPIVTGNLHDVLRQFQGQTYMLSQFTGFIDMKGEKIYDFDVINIYNIKFIPDSSRPFGERVKYTKLGTGRVSMDYWGTRVYLPNKNIEEDPYIYHLSDKHTEIEKIGDYFFREY